MRFFSFCPLLLGLGFLLTAGTYLRAQEPAAAQHLEITGSHTLRLTYESSFTWPAGSGYSAVFRLPLPPDTGMQRIDHFTCSLKGSVLTDEAHPPHRLLDGTLHCGLGTERHVRWVIQVTGQFQTRQLVDGPPDPHLVIPPPAPGDFLASTDSIDWKSPSFQSWA